MRQHWEDFISQQSSLGTVRLTYKESGLKKTVTRSLPLWLGSSPSADIVLNSQAIEPWQYVLHSTDGQTLTLRNLTTSEDEPFSNLKPFGIEVGSLIPAGKNQSASQRILKRCESLETKVSGPIPFLSSIAYPYRMAVYGLTFITGTMAYSHFQGDKGEQLDDRSQAPIAMAYEEPFSYSIDSAPDYRAYRFGVTFDVGVDKELPGKTRLSFDINDLNEIDEMDVWFNDQKITTMSYDSSCITTFCNQSFLIPSGWWKKDHNFLVFKHNKPDSNFAIQNVLLQPVSQAKDLDRQRISDRLAGAERLYAERGITPKNLVTTIAETRKIVAYANAFNDLDGISGQAQVLQEKATQELQDVRRQLGFEIERLDTLGQFSEAITRLKEMQELYGDADQAEKTRIEERISKLTRRSI